MALIMTYNACNIQEKCDFIRGMSRPKEIK